MCLFLTDYFWNHHQHAQEFLVLASVLDLVFVKWMFRLRTDDQREQDIWCLEMENDEYFLTFSWLDM